MASVIAYMSVMDFGLAETITRYYSGYLALDDKWNQSNVLAISGIIYCIISAITMIVGTFIYFNIDTIFLESLTACELNKAKQIFIIMLISIAITISPIYLRLS